MSAAISPAASSGERPATSCFSFSPPPFGRSSAGSRDVAHVAQTAGVGGDFAATGGEGGGVEQPGSATASITWKSQAVASAPKLAPLVRARAS